MITSTSPAAPHKLSTATQLLSFGEEYRPPFYGHINFINMKHLISPFTTGYEGSGIESLYPSNTDIFRSAAEQGAIGGYVHPWSSDPERAGYAVARGFPVDLALGSFTYLEVLTRSPHFTYTAPVWHRALNCGFKITASGGEDSILNLNATPVMGTGRVYAYLGSGLSWDGWTDAIRKGRTFVTNGPLLQFQVNGETPGGEIHLPAEGGSVNVVAQLDTIVPVEKLEIFWNGKPVETVPVASNARTMRIEKTIPVRESGWLTLRATRRSRVIPWMTITWLARPARFMCMPAIVLFDRQRTPSTSFDGSTASPNWRKLILVGDPIRSGSTCSRNSRKQKRFSSSGLARLVEVLPMNRRHFLAGTAALAAASPAAPRRTSLRYARIFRER